MVPSLAPQMIRRGGGSIINMSSISSHLRGIELRAAYGAAKAAIVGLTKAVAREFVRDGVRSVDAAHFFVHVSIKVTS